MKILSTAYLFAAVFFLLPWNVQAQQDIDFQIQNGLFQRCAQDSFVQIEIIPDPNLAFTTVFLDWGDGTTVEIEDPADLAQEHTYDLTLLLESCDYGNENCGNLLQGQCFQISLEVIYADGTTQNNSRRIAFQKPPEPLIGLPNGPYCEGEIITLQNNTCPGNDDSTIYHWVLPDGSTSDEFEPQIELVLTGATQIIMLTATSACGSVTTETELEVIGLPQVNALVDTGDVELIIPDNYRLCLDGSSVGVLLIDSSNINVDYYSWTVSPSSGSMVVGPTDNDSLLVNFTAAGTYTIILVGENGCASDDQDVLTITVIESDILMLTAQPDACPSLSYTPSPLDANATYFIDGVEVPNGDFPITLSPQTDPYVITATKMTECRDFELVDSFFVNDAIQPVINSPMDGDAFCPDTASVVLVTSDLGGTWTPDPALDINVDQASFDLSTGAGDYTFTYTIGSGTCERSTSINLSISAQVISLPSDFEVCETGNPVALTISPVGGELTGDGVNDPLVYEFDPAGLAPGDYPLTYTFFNTATQCTEVGSLVATVVAEPTLEVGAPIQLCNTTSTLLISDQTSFVFTPPSGATFTYAGGGITNPATGAYVPGNLAVGTIDMVAVTYENLPGCLASDTLLVEITGIVMPQAGPDTTICGGGNSFFLGDPQGGCWNGDGAVCDGTVDLSGLAPGDYVYTLFLDQGGLCEISDSKTVTIVPGDGVSLASTQLFICDTAATVSLPTANPMEGNWSGDLPIVGNDINVGGIGPGDYTFSYVVSTLPEGCNSEMFTLSVLAEPQVGLTADLIGCANVDCLDFNATGDLADAYRWTFGDGTTAAAASTCHTYTAAGMYSVGLTGYRLHPVTAQPLCATSPANAQVTILEPPPSVGINASRDMVCPGESVDFSRLNPDDSEFLTFVWDAGFGPDTIADLGAVSFPSPIEDTTYTIYLQTINRCGAILDSVELVVRANPVARIGVVFDQPCSGADLILTNLGTGTIDTSIWTTSDGDQFTTFQPPVLNPFTDSMARDLNVQLIVGNVCRIDTIQTTVTVEPTDVRALPSFTDTTVCLGTPFVVFNNSTPGAGYSVVFNDGNVFTSDTVSHVLDAVGTYQFTVYATGCGFDSSNWHLRVIDLPILTVEADSVICPYEPFDYAFGGNGASYTINLGGVDTTDAAVGNYVFPQVDTSLNISASVISATEGCVREIDFDLLILPQPVALTTVSDSVCAGSPVSFTSLDPSANTCRWLFGDGTSGDGCTASHTYEASDLYLSTLIVTSNFGCTDTVQTPVFVEFSPTADFSLDFDPESCGPTPVQVSALTDPNLASSYFFDLGDGNTNILRDFGHTYFRSGSITVTLRVGWNGLCFDEASQTIDLKKRPFVETELTDDRCNPSDFVRFDITTEDPTDMSILDGPRVIQNGIDRFEFNVPGTYEWIVTSEDGCDTSGIFTIFPKDSLIINADPDYASILLGQSVPIEIRHNNQNLSWTWSPTNGLSDSTNAELIVNPENTITYFVTGTDNNGCFASDTILIEVDRSNTIYVPNAFSPNSDGINDILYVFSSISVAHINTFEIYDRWGELVFENYDFPPNDPNTGWDGTHRGKAMNSAVFAYRIKATLVGGEEKTFKGSITLMR